MQQVLRFVENNFAAFFLFALAWNVVGIALLLWRRSRRGPAFPSIETVNVAFRERFASGVSHLSWLTRFGRATNCLTVILTDSELWVTTFFPFTAFAGLFDLEHRIPTKVLVDVTQKGKSVTIEFDTPDGDRRRIVLRLRRAHKFIAALPPHVVTQHGV